jgi:hypothetical protein
MPLTFVVGAPADVFPPEFAQAVSVALRMPAAAGDAWHSDELDPAGWRKLQTLLTAMLGQSQLAGIDAYQAVWVPEAFSGVKHIAIANAADPLQVASLPALLDELRAFAAAASLPTDDVELMQLAAQYLEDELSFDRDLDVQTYVQLMLAAKQAAARGVGLWIAT